MSNLNVDLAEMDEEELLKEMSRIEAALPKLSGIWAYDAQKRLFMAGYRLEYLREPRLKELNASRPAGFPALPALPPISQSNKTFQHLYREDPTIVNDNFDLNNNPFISTAQNTVIEDSPITIKTRGGQDQTSLVLREIFDDPHFYVVYRILNRENYENLKSAISYATTREYTEDFVAGDRFTPNVIARSLNQCLDITNMKHEFNGKLHCLVKAPKKLFYTILNNSKEDDEESIITTMAVYFEVLTVYNSMVSTLSFVVNGHDHSFLKGTIDWLIVTASALLQTGALGGYDEDFIKLKFGTFIINLADSAGRLNEGENAGVRYFRIKLGPYLIQELFGARPDNNPNSLYQGYQQLIETVTDDYYSKMREFEDRYQDNDDIPDFKGTYDPDTMNRRIETVTFKFIPRAIVRNPIITMNNVIHHKSKFVTDLDNIPPIAITEGDADRVKLNPNLYRADYTDGDPVSPYKKLNSTLVQGSDGLLFKDTQKKQREEFNAWIHNEEDVGYVRGSEPAIPLKFVTQDNHNILHPNVQIGATTLNNKFFAKQADEEELDLSFDSEHSSDDEVNISFDTSGEHSSDDDVDISYSTSGEEGIGCLIDKADKLEAAIGRLTHLWSPPLIADSNCFLRCLMETTKYDREKELNYDEIRQEYGIDHNNHLQDNEIATIAQARNELYYFYRIIQTPYSEMTIAMQQHPEQSQISAIFEHYNTIGQESAKDNSEIFHFLVHHHHCYLMKDKNMIIDKVKCTRCAQWINRTTFSKHIARCFYCQQCRKAYHNDNHACTPNDRRLNPTEMKARFIAQTKTSVCQDWIAMKPYAKGKKITSDTKIWAADIEAFPDKTDDKRFVPYAIGICCLANLDKVDPIIFYGENCMEEYLLFLTKYVTGKLIYFNGSGFDNLIHIKGMIDYGYNIDSSSFIRVGEKIKTFAQHSKLKIIDLCLFINSKLSDACEGWGVPRDKSKKEFDHDKVYSFDSAEKHKVEVLDYLKYDIISLLYLTRIYHKAMWECFSMDVLLCVTPSQYAIQVWSAGCDVLNEIYVPHHGKEEDDDRAAYYGGRVMCQRKKYESDDWSDLPCHEWEYDNIDDYLVIGDVNSLYPAVQFKNNYAYGKWKYIYVSEKSQEDQEEYVNMLNEEGEEENKKRTMFLVDVECPTDLFTSFLMERDKDGRIIHNLLPKIKQWYWGIELIEAQILGYRVTRVYEMKVFEKSGPIFKNYVGTCWEGRQKTAKGSSQNTCYKDAMNNLTGKFGQKSHPTSSVIYSTNYKPTKKTAVAFENTISRIVDFQPIFSNNGTDNCVIMEVANSKIGPRYPIYLSAQILAYSRVYMSQIMRICGSYRTYDRAIFYTDTDSLVMTPACVDDLDKAGLIGKDLGQIKCDLNANFTNNEFAKIVRGIWAATKGPYSLAYVLPQNPVLMEKIKVKGIPHISKPVPYHDPIQIHLSGKAKHIQERMAIWLQDPTRYSLPGSVIGKRFYQYQATGENGEAINYFAKNINFTLIDLIMKKKGTLIAYYGGMKKQICTPSGQPLMIKPDCIARTVCKTTWWTESKRIYLTGRDTDQDLSLPPGFVI